MKPHELLSDPNFVAGETAGRLRNGAELRVLSLWQPWASLVACGAKRFETRSWRPRTEVLGEARVWRGFLAIASARTTVVPELSPELWALLRARELADLEDLPRGSVVALAAVRRVVQTSEIVGTISAEERAAGDWSPGRWAWELELVGRLEAPVPFRAGQGCRDAPRSLALELAAALRPPKP